jgi:hypothetical protein
VCRSVKKYITRGARRTQMPASDGVPHTWTAHVQRSFDAIGWKSLKHDVAFGCIDPPPFGHQCTLPREAAIATCIAMKGCTAITCPEPLESHIGTRGIKGPICQLRSKRSPNEKGHGMCRPGGCINIALTRVRRPLALQGWQRFAGAPGSASLLRNPALVFVHGEPRELSLLLPTGMGVYWPLQRTMLSASSGLLYAVDAVPLPLINDTSLSALDAQKRYRRLDLWQAEHGGRMGRRVHRGERHRAHP